MNGGCQYPLCRGTVPQVLESQGLCALHFLRKVEAQCLDVRREALVGRLEPRRQAEIHEFLFSQALVLAQLATSGMRLGDDARPCILNVLLTLINVCERVSRSGGEQDRPEKLARGVRPLAAAGAK
jgi:hypothetical protein